MSNKQCNNGKYVRKLIRFGLLGLSLLICFAASDPNGIPDREPDVKSVPANLSDYYIYDAASGDWIWKEDYYKLKKQALIKKQNQIKQAKQKEKESKDDSGSGSVQVCLKNFCAKSEGSSL